MRRAAPLEPLPAPVLASIGRPPLHDGPHQLAAWWGGLVHQLELGILAGGPNRRLFEEHLADARASIRIAARLEPRDERRQRVAWPRVRSAARPALRPS